VTTKRTSYPKRKIRILLLEGIHPVAAEEFARAGYDVDMRSGSVPEEELLALAPELHILGIRSRTQVTEAFLAAAKRLLTVGCYCIGTNQVALQEAALHGVPVFNAPFSNTRSVAELAMAEIVMLARRAAHRSRQLHAGRWEKSAAGAYEVRHKTLGIVGYGHIGPQVGLLAEAFGLRVLFYDIAPKLPLGNAQPVESLDTLLEQAEFVSLHVPETERTRGMIGSRELSRMRAGSYLLNLSRGSVVDLDALREALLSGHIAGAAVDVFPKEPGSNSAAYDSVLAGLDNVILTPHIGGSTSEAQRSIGVDVTRSLVAFTDTGASTGAVNFPNVDLPVVGESHRVLNVHRNEPGVLRDINRIVAEMDANVTAQYLATSGDVGYLIMDVDPGLSHDVKRRIIGEIDASIRTRLLF
jgi:D-3-phosphoglycerate dehydrogenase